MSDPQPGDAPVVYNDSMISAQLTQFLVATGFIVTSIPVMIKLFSTRDIIGTIAFFKSDQVASAIGVISAFVLLFYRQWATRRRVAKGAVIAASSPIAVLKSEVAADPSLAQPRETETPAPAMRVVPYSDGQPVADLAPGKSGFKNVDRSNQGIKVSNPNGTTAAHIGSAPAPAADPFGIPSENK